MLLRTRITLMVSLSTIVVVLVLFAEGRMREQQALERYDAALVSGDRISWAGTENSALERLTGYADEILRDDRVTQAVVGGDQGALSSALAEYVTRAQTADDPVEIAIADPRGRVIYAPPSSRSNAVPADVLTAAAQRGAAVRGLVALGNGEYALMVAAPLYSRSGVAGVLAVHAQIAPLVTAMASVAGASMTLTDGSGRVVASRDGGPGRTDAVAGDLPADPPFGVVARDLGGRVLSVDWFRLDDALGRPVLRAAAARDITAAYRRTHLISTLSLGAMLCGGVLFLAGLHWYMRRSFRPLNDVIRVLNALARGDTGIPSVGAAGHDEIGRLAGTLEQFRQAQRARDELAIISQDIDMASRIQSSFLPRDFPTTNTYRVHAVMRPARNVGGDFYDFFELPDGRFGFVVADVSGKGMGAAIFMAMARTVIRSMALVGDDPGVCLARANDFLCTSQVGTSTFVTVFYGILDPETGRVAYANGGHNPPYIRRHSGDVVAVAGTGGMALGVMEELPYATEETVLGHGDHMFLFTDGVTEAMTQDGEQFTEERLERALAGVPNPDVNSLIERVVTAVDQFAGAAPQADDITCLAIELA